MNLKSFKDVDLHGKRVLLRVDYNVPLTKDNEVQDCTRITASLPTINALREKGAVVIIISHAGRPKGEIIESLRLAPMATCLGGELGANVTAFNDIEGEEIEAALEKAAPGDVFMLENIRFYPGEKKNDPEFAKKLAKLGDAYVNDAFAAAHRAHASIVGVAKLLPAYAGLLMEKEIEALSPVVQEPHEPCTLIVGGAKIDTKVPVLINFLHKAQNVLIGGALANTFLAAKGHQIGNSYFQEEKVSHAQEIMREAEEHGQNFVLPVDVVIAKDKDSTETQVVSVEDVPADMAIFDIGPETIKKYSEIIAASSTVIWNGPVGLYECKPFSSGSFSIAQAVADCSGNTLVGGGDSVDAIIRSGADMSKYTHVSTGGGAMLEFLEGKMLPGIEVLIS